MRLVSEKVADDFIEQIDIKKITLFNGAMTGLYGINEGRTNDDEQHTLSLQLYYTDYYTFKCMVEVYHILRSIHDCFTNINKNNLQEFAPFLSSLGLGGFMIAEQENASNLLWVKRSNSIAAGNMWHFSFDETSSILKDSDKNGSGEIVYDHTTQAVKLNPSNYLNRALHEELGLEPESLSISGFLELGIIKSDRLEPEFLAFTSVRFYEKDSLMTQMDSFLKNAPDSKLEISRIEFSPLALGTRHYIGSLLTPEADYLADRLRIHYFSWKEDRTDIRHDKNIYVAPGATIGKSCVIENGCHISGGATIGDCCKIHRNVFIDENVNIGSRVKIQNNNSIYEGVTLEDGVFVGTNVSFTNDLYPRSIRKSDDKPVTKGDWTLYPTTIKKGASIGAGAVIRCGVTIGEWAMVGCGAVVVEDVPPGVTVVGNPARIIQSKEVLK